MNEKLDFYVTMARSLYRHMAVNVPDPRYDYGEGIKSLSEYSMKIESILMNTYGLRESEAIDRTLDLISSGKDKVALVS